MKTKIIQITTPKKVLLNGAIFGPEKPKNIFIFVHGLASDLFGKLDLYEKIINKDTAVLAFNNRGTGIISGMKKLTTKNKKGFEYITAGMAHEVFTDCYDDIAGAVKSAQETGAKNIYLIGHSTGCQKSVYYLAKNKKQKIAGLVMLAPLSDYADVYTFVDKKIYNHALRYAENLVKKGKLHELLPLEIWPRLVDAQRFLSLFTPDSIEEIFSYTTGKTPRLFKKVLIPTLVVFAGQDEYADRPVQDLAAWFKKESKSRKLQVDVIAGSIHNFFGHSEKLGRLIKKWQGKS